MASLQQILSWFKTGLFPTEDQFRQTWLSYWHKSEKIPQSQVFGLKETIEAATRGLIWQNPVPTKSALVTTYPNAQVGWASMVEDEGFIYSFNGIGWANTGLTEFPEDVATKDNLIASELFDKAGLSKINLNDIFSFSNLLVGATFFFNKATGSTGFIDIVGQGSCRISVVPGKKYTIGEFYPLYGYSFIMQDIDGAQVGATTNATAVTREGKTYYDITIPNNSSITQMVFTLYRANNSPVIGQTPFDPNTAVMVEYSDSLLFPLERNISAAFANNIPDYKNVRDSVVNKTYSLLPATTKSGFYEKTGVLKTTFPGYTAYEYAVNDKKLYRVNTKFGGNETYLIFFFDKNSNLLAADYYMSTVQTWTLENYEVPYTPVGTTTIGINSASSAIVTLEEITNNFISSSYLQKVVTNIPYSVVESTGFEEGFINAAGILANPYPGAYKAYSYSVEENKTYRVSAKFGGTGAYYLNYYNVSGVLLGHSQINTNTPSITNYVADIPAGCVLLKVNSAYNSLVLVEKQGEKEYIYSKDLKADIEVLKKEVSRNTYDMEFTLQNGYFLIRSRFDVTRDMVIRYNVNERNNNISPFSAYLGLNTATTSEIASTGFVHYTVDSTPPFLLNNYWYLFGEHGYLIPSIVSTGHDKTAADLGSWWQTSDGKQFQLIKINGTSLTFVPRITKDGSGTNRDKSDYTYGYAITTLIHVSGATHSGNIMVTTNGSTQWIPFTKNVKKKYVCDGIEVTTNGVCKCKELTVVDVHEGYNPITITQYDPVIIGDPICRLTFTHRFTGLSVFVSNSIEAFYPMWINYYGVFQPMGLRNSGVYHPMIFIPKVKEQASTGKITVDWKYPQDCSIPDQNWAKTSFYNNAADLMNVDDIPERIIEYHQNPNNLSDYLIGFAAGYSLLSSATTNEKRKDLTAAAFQLSQDVRNKLYIKCIDFNKMPNQVVPAGYVNNFNFYYSYFNPAENAAKVYWYQEGGKHIVYVHSHLAGTVAVNLPAGMEGKVVQSIVEATDGSVLLTDTVADGVVKASFPDGANYVVFELL